MTAAMLQKVEALESALQELDLDTLEELASTLESRALRKIHTALAVKVESIETEMGELRELLEALEPEDDGA